jgi:enamine deaminase RidA (YjgF/YER057c/UK114 family)
VNSSEQGELRSVEDRIRAMGVVLPPPLQPPPGVLLPFRPVLIVGNRAMISGHGPQEPDGSIGGKLGKLGRDLDIDDGYHSAQLTAWSILSDLQRAIGDLNRVQAWVRVFGMVNSAAGFTRQPSVINGFSDLILDLFGPEAGAHSRSAIGVAELPFNIPVEIEGEVLLR